MPALGVLQYSVRNVFKQSKKHGGEVEARTRPPSRLGAVSGLTKAKRYQLARGARPAHLRRTVTLALPVSALG